MVNRVADFFLTSSEGYGLESPRVVAVSRYLSSEPLANLEDGKRTGVNLVFDPTGNPVGESGVSQLLATAGLPFLEPDGAVEDYVYVGEDRVARLGGPVPVPTSGVAGRVLRALPPASGIVALVLMMASMMAAQVRGARRRFRPLVAAATALAFLSPSRRNATGLLFTGV